MGKILNQLKKDLRQMANPQKARDLARFFKTGKGEYAAGDKFLGVMVPQTRTLVKKYWNTVSLAETQRLLHGKFHEERLLALLILVKKFERGDKLARQKIYHLYLANIKSINNWDLIDLSAPRIVGAYLADRDQAILCRLAKSDNLWERRIAVLATFWFIARGEPNFALKIAENLVHDKEDLIHKAAGWMLREIGKRCGQAIEEEFLQKHCRAMPRTMLRYAIEHFPETKRKKYLHNKS